MAHTPEWVTALKTYVTDREAALIEGTEFTGLNRAQRRNRRAMGGKKVALKVIGRTGFTQPGSGKRFH